VAPYIENFSENDLQFSLVSGSLALKDLQIKREALDAFNLPVEVHKGLIGQFNIYVPLTTLGSEPIRVVIEDVFLLVKMKKVSGDVDLAEEERKLQKVKQDQLRQLEAKEAAAREALAAEKQGQKSRSSSSSSCGVSISDMTSVSRARVDGLARCQFRRRESDRQRPDIHQEHSHPI
jgi:vacuolar protein sorting-associated protein 13A/C